MAITADEGFRNFLLSRSHYLHRFENGTIREMVKPYLAVRGEIYDRLAALEKSNLPSFTRDFRITRMRAQLAEIEGVLHAAAMDATGTLSQALADVSMVESSAYHKMLASKFGPIGVNIVQLPYRQIDWVLSNPLIYQYRGITPGDAMLWGNKEAVDSMRASLTQSIVAGEDMRQAADRLVDVSTKAKLKGDLLTSIGTKAEIIARSEILHVSNQVSRGIFAENQDVLKGVIFTSTLDRRTCIICASKDGMMYPFIDGQDHNGPILPLHPRCRCIYSPWTKSWKELGADPKTQNQKDYFSGKRPDVITYEKWLNQLDIDSPEEVLDILGPGRYRLWKQKKITMSSMARDGRILTLEQLEAKGLKGLAIRPSQAIPAEVRAKMSARQIKAVDNYVPVDKKARSIAEQAERETAKLIDAEHIIGKRPFDLFLDNEFIEHKTFISGRGQIRIRSASMKNKLDFAKKYNVRPHTILVDKRPGLPTSGKMFYRKGLGDFVPQTMTEVKNAEHLKQLLKKGSRKEVSFPDTKTTAVRSKNLKQAEVWIKDKLGVEADYGIRFGKNTISVESANMINGQLTGIYDAYGVSPKKIIISPRISGVPAKTLASVFENGDLYISADFFSTPKILREVIKNNYNVGHFITSVESHILRHEMGHLKYFSLGGTEATAGKKLSIAFRKELARGIGPENLKRYVSRYALRNEGEFYAEMMAKQMAGEVIHSVIRKLMLGIEKRIGKNITRKIIRK